MKIILASKSPARLELLSLLNIKPDLIIPAEINEEEYEGEKPRDVASRLAKEKGLKVFSEINYDSLIISADSVVSVNDKILPKAETIEQAKYCLDKLSGNKNIVYSSVFIIAKKDNYFFKKQKTAKTTVYFRNISEIEIDNYLKSMEWLNKAGGYSIQLSVQRFIKSINGQTSNVVGLPLFELDDILSKIPFLDYSGSFKS